VVTRRKDVYQIKDNQLKTDNPNAHGALVELLDAAISYREVLSEDRRDAQLLYDNDVSKWLPSVAGRSKVVSDDVCSTIGKVLPSLTRTILGNEIVAEFGGQQESDVEGAEQATDYINLVLLDECRARKAIFSAMHDACKMRNGVLHVCADEKIEVRGSEHTKLSENALAAILEEEGVEVLEHSEEQGEEEVEMMGPDGQPVKVPQPVTLHNIKIKRVIRKAIPKMIALPMEEYLIHPDATNSHEDAVLVGREYLLKRSDLVAMMPDEAERISMLSAATYDITQEGEKQQRRKQVDMNQMPSASELQHIQVYDLYVRLDMDGDGIAELRHIMLCGGKGVENVFENEYADFVPYYDVVIEELPHQWEGVSITDHVGDVMLAKTALLRGAKDNLYKVNDPQPVVNIDHVKNPDALLQGEIGRPVFVQGGDNVNNVISWVVTPYIADKALQGIAYWEKQIVERAGIDDSSAGLPPDALQNVTAKASAMLEQKGIAKTEMMVRTVAECLKPAFAGLLRLTIQHTDKPRMIRLRDKFVEVDPRSWNAEMDVSISTGLGAGTRERDMMVMQMIMGVQEKLVALYGPDSPILKPDNIYNAVEKSVQAAGIQAVGKFFTKPDPAEVKAAQEAAAQQKPIEIQQIEAKAMADKMLREMEIPMEMELKKMDVQAAAEKERAQGQAAVEEKIAIAQIDSQAKQDELALKKYEIDTKAQIEREKMAVAERTAEAQRAQEVEKEKAKSFGDSLNKIDKQSKDDEKEERAQRIAMAEKRVVRDASGEILGIKPVLENA
jgi:hypothetical protein